MSQQKRTYAMPAETVERFERAVGAGRRSLVIATLLQEWLDEQERQRLRQDIIEGCHEMAEAMLEIEREFQPADEEVWRAIDPAPQTRRRGARPAQSGRRV